MKYVFSPNMVCENFNQNRKIRITNRTLPLKTLENQSFSDVFKWNQKGTLTKNGYFLQRKRNQNLNTLKAVYISTIRPTASSLNTRLSKAYLRTIMKTSPKFHYEFLTFNCLMGKNLTCKTFYFSSGKKPFI